MAPSSVSLATSACTYSISPGGELFSSNGGTGTVSVTTQDGCPWIMTSASLTEAPWVVLLPATPPGFLPIDAPGSRTTGVGSGNVNYSVGPNPGAARTSQFVIGNQSYTVAQESGIAVPGISLVGSIPQVAVGTGWSTTFTLVNKSPAPVETATTIFDSSGTPNYFSNAQALTLILEQQGLVLQGSSVDQAIGPNASFVVRATLPENASYGEGSAQVAATAAADGFAIFHYGPTNQEAVVPLETRNAPSYLLAFDDTNGLQTGLAVENLSARDAYVPYVFRNDAGKEIDTGMLYLPPNGHTSFVLMDLEASIRGTVEFDTPTSGQISVLGIRYTGGTLTTIPVLANVTNAGGLMAHLASGAGWQTTFALVNTGTTAASATLKFFADNGSALTLPLKVLETGATSSASSITQTLAAGASVWIQSAAAGALLTGSAQLTATGNVSGYAIFRYNPNGQEAVVPLESRNAGSYLIAFDNTNGTATGIAINTISSQPVSVPVAVRDDLGNPLTTGTIQLNANGHTSFTLAQQFPQTAGIRGTVEFDTPASAAISVLGIRSPPALTFTTLPPLAK